MEGMGATASPAFSESPFRSSMKKEGRKVDYKSRVEDEIGIRDRCRAKNGR